MKEKWADICKSLTEADKELNQFLETCEMTSSDTSKFKKFLKGYNELKKLAVDFDKYISPIDAIDIELPFKSDAFNEMWKRWKDYLSEQYGQLIRTRSEKSALEHLDKISKGDEKKAIEFLRYAMANRYKNFFAIDEKVSNQPPQEPQSKGSDWG